MAYNRFPQNANNFAVFDFESSGTDNRKNAVTEIAIITLNGEDLKPIESYQKLIKPYDDTLIYDPKAEKVSGISYDMVMSEGTDIKIVAQEVLDVLMRANIRQEKSLGLLPILIGHNTMFDIGMLHHLFHHGLGDDYQKLMEKALHGKYDYFGNFQPSYFDTWSLGKAWFQEEKELLDYKLATLSEKLGVDLNNAHRAMNDTISTAEVFRKILVNLRSSYTINHKGQRGDFYYPI